jgi:hypothetical protein
VQSGCMRDPQLAYLFVDMAQTAQTVRVFLEQIRIDGAYAQAQTLRKRFHRLPQDKSCYPSCV